MEEWWYQMGQDIANMFNWVILELNLLVMKNEMKFLWYYKKNIKKLYVIRGMESRLFFYV